MISRRKTRMLLAVVLTLGSSIISASTVQDENALDSTDALGQNVERLILFHINLADGELAEMRTRFYLKFFGMPEVLLLQNETVRLDLDLIRQQRNDLDDLIGELDKLSETVLYDVKLREGPPGKLFLQNAAKVLLPHQQSRLRQLFNRFAVEQQGLPENLIRQRLGWLLKVTPDQRTKIKKMAVEYGNELREKSRELRSEVVDDMIKVLTPSQRKKFDEFAIGYVDSRLPPLEILAWQLEHPDEFRDVLADRLYPQYRGFHIKPFYRLDVDGKFLRHPMAHWDRYSSLDPELRAKTDKQAETVLIPDIIFTLQEDPIAIALQLTEEQRTILADLKTRHEKFYSDWNEEWKKVGYDLKSPKTSKDPEYRAYEAQQLQLMKSMWEIVKTSLSEEQSAGLELLSKRLELIRGGLLHSLIYGELRKDLDFTNNQRIEIVDVGERCLKKIQRQSLAWEKEAHEQLFKVLNPEQVEKIEELLGPPLERDRANIDVLIAQFLLAEKIALQTN